MNKSKNKKSALELAFAKLQKLAFSSKTKTKFSKVKYRFEIVEDTDGQVLSYPTLEIGAPVSIGSAGDENTPAPDGWYSTEDGDIRVEDGVIAEIVAEEVSEDFEGEDAPAEVAEEVMDAIAECVNAIQAVAEEVATIHEEVAEVAETVAEVVDATAEFKKQPFSKSVTKEKFQAVDKRAELADYLANKRKTN
ncbi:hypothetical protein [Sphingobacterium chungjuense]|uniref:hypothetical protein n=1 Tax=Sphingobacterium chungjuense TaxID=2675553 RepID=UPI00140B6FA1|nr:hypothetical protein [Sphingobacterium chungjuense]